MKPIVTIHNLQKTFCKGNICVANHLNITINEGEIFTVLGRSGSGKTTFLWMLAGLESSDSGEIRIGDKVVFDNHTNLAPNQRDIAIVFQNYALLPHLTIKQNITFGSNPHISDLNEVITTTKIDAILEKFPHEISGGQQQRVALARAILNKPKILLLDEPLSNIDTELRALLRIELKEMIKAFGITALFITHDKEDAFFLSDKIAIMDGGNVLQIGTPKEIYHHPNSLYCANFLGKINHLPEPLLRTFGLNEKESYCRLDAILLGNNFVHKAMITDIVFYGNFYEIFLDFEGFELIAHSFDNSLHVKDMVGIQIDTTKIISF